MTSANLHIDGRFGADHLRSKSHLSRLIGWLLFAVVVAWLVYRITRIGWIEVWEARPRVAGFYIIWLALYLQLPFTEWLIYRRLWDLPAMNGLLPLLQKRTLNQDVATLSGEVYLFFWARKRLNISHKRAVGAIKDNLVAASVACWTAILLLLTLTAPSLLTAFQTDHASLVAIAVVAIVGLGIVLVARFRHVVFTLTGRQVLALVAIHMGRYLVLVFCLQVLQWWVVVPDAPLSLLLGMLLLMTAFERIPFLPARDLAGVAVVLGVTNIPATLVASVAAMLLAKSCLDKTLNLVFLATNQVVSRVSQSQA
jgi:hypothetical protein